MHPENAAAMSFADNLVEQGHEVSRVLSLSPTTKDVFRGMLELGATPAELRDK